MREAAGETGESQPGCGGSPSDEPESLRGLLLEWLAAAAAGSLKFSLNRQSTTK